MNFDFKSLSQDQQAEILVNIAAINGLANVSELKSDFGAWKDSDEANSFAAYLLSIQRFNENEISALLATAGRAFAKYGKNMFAADFPSEVEAADETLISAGNRVHAETKRPVGAGGGKQFSNVPPHPAAESVGTTPSSEFGEAEITNLVAAFYARVRKDDLIGPMYPASDWEGSEKRLREFLIFRFGGSDRYIQERGHPRLRMRHAPFVIGLPERDRWLELMAQAMICLLYTSPSPRDATLSRMPSSA